MRDLLTQAPLPMPLKSDGHWRKLFATVSGSIAAEPDLRVPPLSEIRRLLEKDCSHAVVEFGYLDEDVVYDYMHDYGWFFQDPGRACVRVHFFGGKKLASRDWISDLRMRYDCRRPDQRSDRDPYLGYMVVRPTGARCIGRTVIADPYTARDSKEEVKVVHARMPCRAHLCGVVMQVTGAPFMQQDRSSHVCAGAALWTLAYDLHRRYGGPRLFPRQITEIATQGFARAGVGLSELEHTRVLRHISCAIDSTHIRLPDAPVEERRKVIRMLVNTLYGYIQSNAPVLISYWWKDEPIGHTVLAVGHNMQRRIQCPRVARPTIGSGHMILASDYVSEFYVQDDKRGPYQPLRVWNKTGKVESTSTAKKKDVPVLEDAEYVLIIPGIPGSTRLFYREALDQVAEVADSYRYSNDKNRQRLMMGVLKQARVRLYFQRAVRFRSLLVDAQRGREGMSPKHVDAYLTMRLPRHVYVCDFCTLEPSALGERRFRVRGEMLLDATSPPFSQRERFLAMRIGSQLLIAGRNKPVVDRQYGDRALPWAPVNFDDHQ